MPPACKVKILSVHPELLGDITSDAVRAEGFPDGDVEKFIAGFKGINAKKDVGDNPRVWVVKFKLHHEPRQSTLI